MREGAVLAAFDAPVRIAEVPAAVFAHRIERAVAEQTVEIFQTNTLVAGEEFTFPILAKFVVFHVRYTSVQG